MENYSLMVFDDPSKTKQFFMMAIKSSVPRLSIKTVDRICSIIHNEGMCICAYGPLEIIEMYKEKMDKFGLQSIIGVYNEKFHTDKR